MPDLAITPLDDLTVLSVRGADTAAFLQGQLSQDISQLAVQGALLAGLHNPQGRVLALLRLLHLTEDQMLVILPLALSEGVRRQLERYVLRSRVRIEAAGSAWSVYGLAGPDAEAAASTRLHMPADQGGMRHIIVAPRGEAAPEAEASDREEWRLEDIAAGIPEIFTATGGVWVAQMLNLDLLGAISFNKGCYTGQEVIARAHFRGQVKRRMQRFTTDSDVQLVPGTRVTLADRRTAQIVMSASAGPGTREFLAVTSISQHQPLQDDAAEPGTPSIPTIALPLPYGPASAL
jgi:folate-binding protein YgfZ